MVYCIRFVETYFMHFMRTSIKTAIHVCGFFIKQISEVSDVTFHNPYYSLSTIGQLFFFQDEELFVDYGYDLVR